MNYPVDLLNEINDAVLDLQTADYQGFAVPLKRLGRLLNHQDLAEINLRLTAGLDVEAFIAAGELTQGGMVGSAKLPWPDDDVQILGLQMLLILKFVSDPEDFWRFGHTFYYSGNKLSGDIRSVTSNIVIPFARDYKKYVLSQGNVTPRLTMPRSTKIFIVHGHDGEARKSLARFLSQIDLEPIILHEQANLGRTVIEKVEAHGDVGFAVVLLTPDDLGRAKAATELEPRARQNVLLELGYFIGRLGREHVCTLRRGDVQVPSDFAGVVWEAMDEGGGWKHRLGRELEAAGYALDWNKVMH